MTGYPENPPRKEVIERFGLMGAAERSQYCRTRSAAICDTESFDDSTPSSSARPVAISKDDPHVRDAVDVLVEIHDSLGELPSEICVRAL
jgi:hypothetical protein